MLDIRTEPLALCQIILEDYLRAHQDIIGWTDRPIADLMKHPNVRISDCVQKFAILPAVPEAKLIDAIPAFLRTLVKLSHDYDMTWCTDPIVDFHGGDNEIYSNFSASEVVLDQDAPVERDHFIYPTVEHAFVAAKCADISERTRIWGTGYAGNAKKIGKTVTLRSDWNDIRLMTMSYLLQQKFTPYTKRAEQLNHTGYRVLVESNTWNDTTWGICNKRGTNWLGLLLMAIRADQRH